MNTRYRLGSLLFFILLLSAATQLRAQSAPGRLLFYIDSIPVLDSLDPTENTLQSSEIAVFRHITSQDTISRLGFKNIDTLVFIITKAWQNRPDSVKQIPTLKKLAFKDRKFYADTNQAPYNGPFIEYYLNGARKTSGEIVKGQIEGYANVYYPDGSLMESHYYSHNIEDGMREEYFPNHVISRRGMMKEGELEGYWQEWYSTGKLKRELYFAHSVPHYPDEENVFYNTLQEAVNDIESHQYKPALRNLEDLKKANPDYADVHYHMGEALYHLKKYDKALESLNKALELEPLYTEAHVTRAYTNAAILQAAEAAGKPITDTTIRQQICGDLKAAREEGDHAYTSRMLMQQYCK